MERHAIGRRAHGVLADAEMEVATAVLTGAEVLLVGQQSPV